MILHCLLCFILADATNGDSPPPTPARPWTRRFTILIDPGSRDCFHFPNVTAHAHALSVRFQVLGGAGGLGGALALAAVDLYDPQGRMLESVSDAPSGDYRISAAASGDYAVCVDNAASSLSNSAKTVFLGVSAELERSGDEYGDEYYYEGDDYFDREEMEAMQQADVQQVY